MSTASIKKTRAERLDTLLRYWIFNTVQSIDGDKFMSHIAPLTPGNEKEVHNAIVQGLNWFKTELENLSDGLKNEYDLSTKTSELEKLTEEARQLPPIDDENKRVIPTPDQAMFAAKLAHGMEFYQQLQNELDKTKKYNYELMDKHVALNREVLNKKRRIENLTQEFSKMIEELKTIPHEELLELMSQLDVEAIINNKIN